MLTLVERGGGARSFHVDRATVAHVMPIIRANIARESALMTDEFGGYRDVKQHVASHETVNHSKDEYVRGNVHTNTVEGYYSIFKRGMVGVYQHCAEHHLHRYLAEFDFRYSNRIALGIDDGVRTIKALAGAKASASPTAELVEAKKLHYRKPVQLNLPLWRYTRRKKK